MHRHTQAESPGLRRGIRFNAVRKLNVCPDKSITFVIGRLYEMNTVYGYTSVGFSAFAKTESSWQYAE